VVQQQIIEFEGRNYLDGRQCDFNFTNHQF